MMNKETISDPYDGETSEFWEKITEFWQTEFEKYRQGYGRVEPWPSPEKPMYVPLPIYNELLKLPDDDPNKIRVNEGSIQTYQILED